MRKDAKIYIAGHTGLIGSAMLRRLKADGYSQIITLPRTQLDLQDATRVERFFDNNRPEYVVLAAGRVGGIVENQTFPASFMNENMSIQLNVMRAALKTDVTKLILFGSSCMYPKECVQPMSEDILLSGTPEPTSLPYAISKLAGTYLCLAYNEQYKAKRFIPVIPNSVYGPNDNFDPETGHVLSALIYRLHEAKINRAEAVVLWGSGAPQREFVHADDVAEACLRLLQQDVSTLKFPINIGVGSDISINDLARMIADVIGYAGRFEWDLSKPDGVPRKLLDSTRLRQFGWRPKVGFLEGLRSTYEWYVRSNS